MAQLGDKVKTVANGAGPEEQPAFWKRKPLEALDSLEWERLCDGCGRCCLLKLEDVESGEIHYTNIACRLFDARSCRCRDYRNRADTVPSCLVLTPRLVRQTDWLPPTCAYRLVAEGRDLYWWHPLVSGDPETVVAAGISVRGRTVGEYDIAEQDFEDYVADWPVDEGPADATSRSS